MILNKQALKNLIGGAADYCVLFVPLNGELTDHSGHGHTFSKSGSPPYVRASDGSQCLSTTTSKYIYCADSDDFTFPSGTAFSVCGWHRQDSATKMRMLFAHQTATQSFFFGEHSTSGYLRAYASGTTPTAQVYTTAAVGFVQNKWEFSGFATSNDNTSTNTRIFHNGSEVALTYGTNFNGVADIAGQGYIGYDYYDSTYTTCSYRNIMVFKGIALTTEQFRAIQQATFID